MPSISEALIWIYHFAVGLDISKWSATFVIFFFSRVSQNCRTSSISFCFLRFSLGLYIVSWKGNGFYCHRVVPDHPGSWVVYYHNAAW